MPEDSIHALSILWYLYIGLKLRSCSLYTAVAAWWAATGRLAERVADKEYAAVILIPLSACLVVQATLLQGGAQ